MTVAQVLRRGGLGRRRPARPVPAGRRRFVAIRRLTGRVFGTTQGRPPFVAAVLILMAVLMSVLIDHWPSVVPWTSFVPFVVLGGLFLPPRWLAFVLVVIGGLLAHDGWLLGKDKPNFAGAFVVILIVSAMMTWLSVSRARLGVHGIAGESMLVDLRDRLRAHGELPTLPEPWHAEVALEPAHGESFSGDFVVATRASSGNRLEVALVDVSGKGLDAGTRALLLSGALGGLMGALDPADFLGAANSYLLRQKWGEGFATAIHVALELDTGRFCLGTAGHPPAVKFSAGSGRWQVLDAETGPLLGVLDSVPFPRVNGQLCRGDALLLCTDGVIETRTRDLEVGIDRMLGAAERLVPHGFSGGASRICAAPFGVADDRGVVLIWRT